MKKQQSIFILFIVLLIKLQENQVTAIRPSRCALWGQQFCTNRYGDCVNQQQQCEQNSYNCYYCSISWENSFYCGESKECAQYWWIWVVGASGFLLIVAIVVIIIIIKKRQRAQKDQLLLAANTNQQPLADVIYTPNQDSNGFNSPQQEQQQYQQYNNNNNSNNYIPPSNNNTGVFDGQPTHQIYQ